MDSDGTQDARGTHADRVPRPAGPPQVPPRPAQAPGMPPAPDGSTFLTWLRTPRPEAAPGVWRFGHLPRPDEEPEEIPTRQLLSGALIAFLVGWLIWSLLQNRYLGDWWWVPLYLITPDSWRGGDSDIGEVGILIVYRGYELLVALAIMIGVGRVGRWGEVWRRFVAPACDEPCPSRLRRRPRKTPPSGTSSAPPEPPTPPSGSVPRPGPDGCAMSTRPGSPGPGRACGAGGTVSPPSAGPY